MQTGYLRGHLIVFKSGEWVFEDNGEPIVFNWQKRCCKECGKLPTKDGHDACIENLPGVRNACCGHGEEKGYVQFEDGRIIRGYLTVEEK